jgi:ABC-type multidrug transport system fused ATPase/permease subunit
MLIRSPRLAACALSIIPVVAVVNKYYGSWLAENARKVQDALAEANSVAQETFSCVQTVIAFASESLEYNKYVERVDEQYRLNVKQVRVKSVSMSLFPERSLTDFRPFPILVISSRHISRASTTCSFPPFSSTR